MSEKFAVDRQKFEHSGRTIYEWDQNIEEVNLYIKTPEGVRAKFLDCNITPNHVSFGIKGNPPYLSHDLFAPIKQKDSFWTLEDGELHITLQKLNKGESWLAVFKGHEQLDPAKQEELKKRLMLERFQEEHPGFDFSQAQFSGSAPDPRTFMGGMA